MNQQWTREKVLCLHIRCWWFWNLSPFHAAMTSACPTAMWYVLQDGTCTPSKLIMCKAESSSPLSPNWLFPQPFPSQLRENSCFQVVRPESTHCQPISVTLTPNLEFNSFQPFCSPRCFSNMTTVGTLHLFLLECCFPSYSDGSLPPPRQHIYKITFLVKSCLFI